MTRRPACATRGDKTDREPRHSAGNASPITGPARHSPARGPGTAGEGASPLPAPVAGLRLYIAGGARKYVTAGERDAFLRQAKSAGRQVRTLCMTLA